MMQALSQAARNPESHFAIMIGEKYLTYLFKVQVSQDPILIHSARSALGNHINGLVHGFRKAFVLQIFKESATAFEVDPTNMIEHGKKKKMSYTELLKAKTSVDIEAIYIPEAT